jgi:hypothetical protein
VSSPDRNGPIWSHRWVLYAAQDKWRIFLLPLFHLHDPNHVASIRSSMYVSLFYECTGIHNGWI